VPVVWADNQHGAQENAELLCPEGLQTIMHLVSVALVAWKGGMDVDGGENF